MKIYEISAPVSENAILPLRAGDRVFLSGTVYTARDQAHRRITEAIAAGEQLPFELKGSAIYYVGPTPEKPGTIIGSAGPTTSGRMDAYAPLLISLGNRIMIGKGKRSPEVMDSIVKYGAVYLGAPGGAGALLAQCITASKLVAWPELGCEAVRCLTVKNMPLTVIADTQGGNLYDKGPTDCLKCI